MPQSYQHHDSLPLKPIHNPSTSHFKVLQYNVNTTIGEVTVSLLAYHHNYDFTFIIAEEPLLNPHIHTTHNPSNLLSHPLYSASANASICFYVKK
jgi:hypothetical protein